MRLHVLDTLRLISDGRGKFSAVLDYFRRVSVEVDDQISHICDFSSKQKTNQYLVSTVCTRSRYGIFPFFGTSWSSLAVTLLKSLFGGN